MSPRPNLDQASDHLPMATTDQSDSAVLLCSCGWDSSNPKAGSWEDHLPDSLDAAWAEVEAAKSEGTYLHLEGLRAGKYHAYVVGIGGKVREVTDPNPAAALRALAAKLREVM
jgi:hypothetical protein